MQGTVKWFNNDKGYGFIVSDGYGSDIFVHYSNVQGVGYISLEANVPVEFDIEDTGRGPAAKNVQILEAR